MTSGHSRAQARAAHDQHAHLHQQQHQQRAHSHDRLQHSHEHESSGDLQDRGAAGEVPKDAAQDVASVFTHIIQTISLVKGTDAAGNPAILTLSGPPGTVVVDSHTGETLSAILPDNEPANPVPAPAPAPAPITSEAPIASEPPLTSSSIPSSSQSSRISASSEFSAKAASQPQGTVSVPPEVPITPTPLPSSVSLSVKGGRNATHSHAAINSSTRPARNSTIFKALDFSTTPLAKTSTKHHTLYSHTTLSSSFSSSSWSSTGTSTTSIIGGFGGDPGDTEDSAQPTGSSGGGSGGGDPLSPQEKQIVGGVVGGIAGAAFFILLIMMALRYKKRKHERGLDGEPDSSGMRRITSGSEMAERSVPAAVAAALASLTGKRPAAATDTPQAGDRGFYRVSGRKLQPVLQSGGDGYTDPHDSVGSGVSDYYRGSQAFEPGGGPSNKLALGTPMRPVSGVMVMRDGPGRTPVTEQNPFADPPTPPPPHGPGTLGRSLPSQDGSRGSRFQEGI